MTAEAIAGLQQYQCHKRVQASRIVSIELKQDKANFDNHYMLGIGNGASIRVSVEWVNQFGPTTNGYYVVDEDGRALFLTAGEFESGFTKL